MNEDSKPVAQDETMPGATPPDAAGLSLEGEGNGGNAPEIVKYGRICADRLGALPAFSCLDGKIIPITVTDANGNTTSPTTPVARCDKPIYLPTGDSNFCKPYARIGKLTTKPNVETAFICRRYGAVPGPEHPTFDDVAVIQHNTVTGETCWFQALSSAAGPLFGKRVPPPNELSLPNGVEQQARRAEAFWLPPQDTAGITCVSCHDSDPFIHSPYVDQVQVDGKPLVPSSPKSRYAMLGGDFGFKDWPVAYNVTPAGNALCNNCHRIGSMQTCETWARDSSARRPFNQNAEYLRPRRTARSLAYPDSYWMPPAADENVHHASIAEWDQIAGDAWAKLEQCCARPLGQAQQFAATAAYGTQLSSQRIQQLQNAGCTVTRTTFTAGDQPPPAVNLPLQRIQLPAGFRIAVYATVKGARSLTLSPSGTVYVGTGGFSNPDNKIYAVRDNDGDHVAEQVVLLKSGLDNPNGVTFHDGNLYVAERFRITRYDAIEDHLSDPPEPVTVYDGFPQQNGHSWKYLRVGPDNKLYVGIGSNGNIHAPHPRFATIARLPLDGSSIETFAKGVRNSVGFDWHPVTGDFYFTDNGRDNLGNNTAAIDNQPPDELNKATAAGQHFGHPSCHGTGIVGTSYPGAAATCDGFVRPVRDLGPHVAALGMRFYTGAMFPETYRNQAFIAEHGSWNRSHRIGYRVTLVKLGAEAATYETFAQGWLNDDESVWGRPVDVLVMPDGALLVSDDVANVIYRISYQGH